MIIQVSEQFHDHEKRLYYVETDKLEPQNNVIDNEIIKACKKKAFSQDVHINADEYREQTNWAPFWDDPGITEKAKIKVAKSTKPEKIINLTIFFDC